MTEFKQIDKYPNYGISTEGVVKNLKTNKILKPTDVLGYDTVMLSNEFGQKRKYIAKLVAEAYLPNKYNLKHIYHINNDKKDNRVENLCWAATRSIVLDRECKQAVCKIDKETGYLLKIYPNVLEAAVDVAIEKKATINFVCSAIYQTLSESRKSGYGYKWKYLQDYHFSREDF